MPKKPAVKTVPMEVAWATEKLRLGSESLAYGLYAEAASSFDMARQHLECAALQLNQPLRPRTDAAQGLERRHAILRGPFAGPANTHQEIAAHVRALSEDLLAAGGAKNAVAVALLLAAARIAITDQASQARFLDAAKAAFQALDGDIESTVPDLAALTKL